MNILAIDPGAKPGYVQLDTAGRAVWVSTSECEHVRVTSWDVVVVELQWYNPHGKINPNDLLTLAFRAGWQARGARGARTLALKPQTWRGNSSLDKAQVQRQIVKGLTDDEKRLFAGIPKTRHGDVLDAIGLGRKGVEIALKHPKGDSEFEWPPELATKPKRRRTKR